MILAASGHGDKWPTFSVEAKWFPMRYYVLAQWKDGRNMRITRFHERATAEEWIAYQAEDWLRDHFGALPGGGDSN